MLGVELVEKAEPFESRQALSLGSREKARNTTRPSNATDLVQRALVDRGGDPHRVAFGYHRGGHASRAIRSL